MKKWVIILAALCCLIMSCATTTPQTRRVEPDPFYKQSWWGMDPTCAPGCPSGQAGGW